MNHTDKSNEELISELIQLQKSYDDLKEQFDEDLSLLKMADERFTKSEELFRKAFTISPDSININRLSDGVFVSVNPGFTRMLGYSEQEAIGKSSLELNIWVDPENRKALTETLQEKGWVNNFEAPFRGKDGDIIFGLMSASLIELEGVPHILNVTKDITSRKLIEETLAKEQFVVASLMNNIPDHVYFKDLESRFIRINKSHAALFGLNDPALAIGKTDFDFFSSEHAQQAFDDEQEIILTGKLLSKEEKETHSDRPYTWVSTVKMPLLDKYGNIIGTFGISRDITEQKKAEEQFFLLANALKSTNECVSITDIHDKVLFLNKAFIDTYGFTEDDLKEENINLIRSSNNPQEISDTILPETLKGGWHGELLNRKKDGSEFMVSLSTAVVKDSEGEPVAFIGVANDITERKRLEIENHVLFEIAQAISATSRLDELLKLIHQSLSKVVYAENCFVALYNHKTSLFTFPYFVDKFDSTPEPTAMAKSCTAYVFRTATPLVVPPLLFKQLVAQNEVKLVGSPSPSWIGIPLKTPSKIIGVLVLQHYEKEDVYSDNDLKFLSSVGGQMALSIERRRAEEEIILKNEQLQAINAEKDKFFSIIAHDLRGPLSAFVAATQIITEDIMSMSTDDIREITMTMKSDASNIYTLLENLLEWSRLQRGVMEFNPQKLNLDMLINAGIEAINGSAKSKAIVIESIIPHDIEVTVDKHMYETVIRNLISNAVKFTKSGGKITVSVSVDSEKIVEVRIQDNGIGMSEELKNRLFRVSEKTNRPGTAGEPSSGLGLLLCKEFIEKHGGTLRVESEVGKGSTFAFTMKQFD